jgi:hypothetical protein
MLRTDQFISSAYPELFASEEEMSLFLEACRKNQLNILELAVRRKIMTTQLCDIK